MREIVVETKPAKAREIVVDIRPAKAREFIVYIRPAECVMFPAGPGFIRYGARRPCEESSKSASKRATFPRTVSRHQRRSARDVPSNSR